jgi:hypothetical protein
MESPSREPAAGKFRSSVGLAIADCGFGALIDRHSDFVSIHVSVTAYRGVYLMVGSPSLDYLFPAGWRVTTSVTQRMSRLNAFNFNSMRCGTTNVNEKIVLTLY